MPHDWHSTTANPGSGISVEGFVNRNMPIRPVTICNGNRFFWRAGHSDFSFGTITALTAKGAEMISDNAREHNYYIIVYRTNLSIEFRAK